MGRPRPLWARLGALLGCRGALVESSWTVLVRSWGALGPPRGGGPSKRRTCVKIYVSRRERAIL
eukprot:5693918-Pyramimonas_sp.AAC.1